MPTTDFSSRRIAKNTLFLYFRMISVMLVTLYTSRVVLRELGVEDYGIYNVVAGVAMMFLFINNAMISGVQRFLSVELGRKNAKGFNEVFSASIAIHLGVAVTIFILCETVGLYIIDHKVVVPPEKMASVGIIYQLAVFSVFFSVMNIPFVALIVSKEKMGLYGYIAVIEVVVKLLAACSLSLASESKLVLYGGLMFALSALMTLSYIVVDKVHFRDVRLVRLGGLVKIREILLFTVWNIGAEFSIALNNYGVNILLNMFFGPVVNAARGITYQVSNAMAYFRGNFQQAAAPQITKLYAENNIDMQNRLVLSICRYSFFLMYFISVCVFFEAHAVLKIWLEDVPEYTVSFLRIAIINSLVCSFANPMTNMIMATGKIRLFRTIFMAETLAAFLVCYALLVLSFPPQAAFFSELLLSCALLFTRLAFINRMSGFKSAEFFWKVLAPIFKAVIPGVAISVFVYCSVDSDWLRFALICLTNVVIFPASVYLWGINDVERGFCWACLKSALERLKTFR